MNQFPDKPTTKDLSDTPVLKQWPAFNSSMLGGNTVTKKLEADGLNSGQGSDSEATHDVINGDATYVGNAQDTPGFPGAATPDSETSNDDKSDGAGHHPPHPTWKEA